MRKTHAAVFIFLVAGCATDGINEWSIPSLAVRELHAGQEVELEGWVEHHGELIVFDSKAAQDHHLVFPYCISAGLSSELHNWNPSDLHRQTVKVRGTLLSFDRTKRKDGTIKTASVIEGIYFKNFCFGPYVLRIDEISRQ